MPFRTDSDDVLFGAPIITIYLSCMGERSLHNLSFIQRQVSKSIEFNEKTLDYMERFYIRFAGGKVEYLTNYDDKL